VVIAVPEDMLKERVVVPDAKPFQPIETWPGLTDMSRLQKLLWAAEKPILILGGSRWSESACAAVARFAERFALPVVTSFRRSHLFDQYHECYAGDLGVGPNPKLVARIKGSDLIILAGARLSEMPAQGYTLLGIPETRQTLVHVHPGAEELGRVYHPHLAIHAAPTAFAASLEGLQAPDAIKWRAETQAANSDYRAWTDTPTKVPGEVNLGEIVAWLRGKLPPEAILTNGAGNYSAWMHRFYRFRKFGTLFGPISGSMGYSVPSAVAAKRIHPDRPVVCFAGDGCFMMHGQEFATAVQYNLPLIIVVCDNSSYGTIRMHQEREYPGRVTATELRNPDFAAYARAFGGHGATVLKTAEFAGAYEEAVKSGKPAIIHVKTATEAISPSTTLTAIREKAQAGR
jgi:acetolactate synthase-1/2/3 large subunit